MGLTTFGRMHRRNEEAKAESIKSKSVEIVKPKTAKKGSRNVNNKQNAET